MVASRNYETVGDVLSGYSDEFGMLVAEALKRLLETKHLYQSVVVNADDFENDFWNRVSNDVKDHLGSNDIFPDDGFHMPWNPDEDYGVTPISANRLGVPRVVFKPLHVKVFCRICQRVEPFNPVAAGSAVDSTKYERPIIKGEPAIEQVYSFTLLCQSCKRFPEVFLVRRTGPKLVLSGRSPMEHVPVPQFVPKEIEQYYSGSVIAYQSGQTLAALFLLRTACEQWARKFADPRDFADDAMKKYMAKLPEDFKSRFPSLPDIYSKLSADIHAAIGSTQLFEQMIKDLNEHFQARQVFRDLKS